MPCRGQSLVFMNRRLGINQDKRPLSQKGKGERIATRGASRETASAFHLIWAFHARCALPGCATTFHKTLRIDSFSHYKVMHVLCRNV